MPQGRNSGRGRRRVSVRTSDQPKLTQREAEVLTWAARGKTAAETSRILTIAEQTVKDHLKAICRKLQVSNKTHAVSVALTRGFIAL